MSNENKDIFEAMESKGYFDYGNIIPQSEIQSIFNIQIPDTGSLSDFQEPILQELAAIGFIRDQLINEGRYIKKDGASYRVLLPNENAKQADLMLDSAKRKSRRAAKLLKSTKISNSKKELNSINNLEMSLDRIQKHNLLVA